MTGIAINCITDIADRLNVIPSLKGKVFHVYSEQELTERTKGLTLPCVGVVYDGLRSVGESGDTSKMGMSSDIVVTIMLFFKQDTRAKVDPKDTMVALMDSIRDAIIGTRSPSGHNWKFQMEIPVAGKLGVLAYLQRWSTSTQLVPKR